MQTPEKYDLLVKDGRVMIPVRGSMTPGVRYLRRQEFAAVERDIPAGSGKAGGRSERQTCCARTG